MKNSGLFDKHFAEIHGQNTPLRRFRPRGKSAVREIRRLQTRCRPPLLQTSARKKHWISRVLEITGCPEARAMVQMREL